MKEDSIQILQNPTPEVEQLKEELMKISNDALRKQILLMETFLFEFCEVNGIVEEDLYKHLQVAVCTGDKSVMAVNADDIRDIKFCVKVDAVNEKGNLITKFDAYGEKLDKYPKTFKLIEEIKNE